MWEGSWSAQPPRSSQRERQGTQALQLYLDLRRTRLQVLRVDVDTVWVDFSARKRRIAPALRLWLVSLVLILTAAVFLGAGSVGAATSNVTVTATVPSATNLAIDSVGAPPNGCETGTTNVTAFGTVLPGSSAVTSTDCNVVWGSSNDSALLRIYQADGGGVAMRAAPTTGLVADWPLNGSGADMSATNNAVTLDTAPNDPVYATSAPDNGQGLDFDADDRASASSNAAYDLNVFTVDAWFKTAASGVMIQKTGDAAGCSFDCNYELWVSGGKVRADLSSGPSNYEVASTANYNDDNWHHAAMTLNASRLLTLYVDGVSVGTPLTLPGAPDTPSASVLLGHSSDGLNTFVGQLDEVRIHNVVRSASEIRSAYLGAVKNYDDDNVGSDYNWTEGSNMFGACLETATNGATGGAGVGGWTVAGDNNCTTGSAAWNPIAATAGSTGSKIAAVTPGPDDNAAVSLRFGFKAASNQAPGTYTAPVVFEVIAPNT